MPIFAFCHGWTVDERKGFSEVTCRRRESCPYYDVDFYRHHGHHLEDFEELFPSEPCQYFTKPVDETPADTDEVESFLSFIKKDDDYNPKVE